MAAILPGPPPVRNGVTIDRFAFGGRGGIDSEREIDVETHDQVFTWVAELLAKDGLLRGQRLGVDATTLEANAAMRSIVRRDSEATYKEFLGGLAKASGVETPTREDLARLDRKRKNLDASAQNPDLLEVAMRQPPKVQLQTDAARRLADLKLDIKYYLIGKLGRLLLSRDSDLFADIEKFYCFVGHGRSGSSLVGALLNAHPNVVTSDALHALRRIRHGLSDVQLYRLIYIISRRQVARGSKGGGGYAYNVPGQWQGRHRRLLVIGDRKAGATATEIAGHTHLLKRLAERVPAQKRFINVVRNPLDSIATTFTKTHPRPKETTQEHLRREIANYFARCSAVRAVSEHFGPDNLLHAHHEELVRDPRVQLARLCAFLSLETSDDYLESCAHIVNRKPSRTRESIRWSTDSLDRVNTGMLEFPWLHTYADDCDA